LLETKETRMFLTGAQILTGLLERAGIHTLSGIPGGTILPLYDALARSGIRHVLARHEQGAGFIAQGMSRASGRTGVALATSGPGVTNLLTAIADAMMDSIPMLAITAQVPTPLIGTRAFQEVDTLALATPITKRAYRAKSAREILEILPEALRAANEGKPGPVLLDIPKDVFLDRFEFQAWPSISASRARQKEAPRPSPGDFRNAARLIRESERPLIYLGGGARHGAATAVAAFARKNGIPVATTLQGVDCFPAGDPLRLGMLGMHGGRAANLLVAEADLLIALGARFDDRATGKPGAFAKGARILHVDLDAREIGRLRGVDQALVGDLGAVLEELLPLIPRDSRDAWRAQMSFFKAEFPESEGITDSPFDPSRLIQATAEALPHDAIVTTDVGQHQMWVAQQYPFRAPGSFLTSGGLGTMGFGLPAAIGASLACPHRRVACFTGDGSLLMNLQELATLAEHRLPVAVLLMDNGHLGMVRQQQELLYENRTFASRFAHAPDFCALARAFGIEAIDLEGADEPQACLKEALARHTTGPLFVRWPVPAGANVWPMVAPGSANTEMMGEVRKEQTTKAEKLGV
jgi:acetolactate synthase-1/2/3 large subunit